jgi:type I restriction enzyme M protein
MAVKKSEIYSTLWASCDKLRGGMDASQYKDYILTLLFIKYVSDKYENELYGAIVIPPKSSFNDLVALKGNKNIGEEIDKLIARIAEANNLTNVINNAHFNDEVKIGKGQEMVDKLTGLIAIFQRPELDFKNNHADNDDLIGDAYEYLMRNFATASGKSKGQFYTPAEVSRILAKVIGVANCKNKDATIYDPACGSGSLLIRAANEAPFPLAIYGQEKDSSTAGLAKMNLVLHNKAEGEIAADNTFANPFYRNDQDNDQLRQFDYIVANPPFSMKNWTDGLKEFGRFDGYGDRPPEKNGDYSWLMHIIKSMKNDTGKAAVILPHGVLFRGNAEETIRKTIIDRHLIKGIIGLPANLFYGTGIPACIIVLDKEKAKSRTGIFMIDASHGFMKDKDKNRLREQDIYKIVTTFNAMNEIEGFSRFVPVNEIIEKNAYNLNIPRYIDSTEKEDEQSIDAHLYGGIPQEDIDSIPKFWEVFPDLKNTLFKKFTKGFCQLAINTEDVHTAIFSNPGFTNYNAKVTDAFSEWKKYADASLLHLKSTDSNKKIIEKLSQKLIEIFEPLVLLDKYDVYQVLLAYWNETMNDDVLLIIEDEQGYEVAKETEDISEEIKNGKNKGKYKVVGWDGKVIPQKIILAAFFSKEVVEIENKDADISQKKADFEEFVENNSDDDGFLSDYIGGDKDTEGKDNQNDEDSKIDLKAIVARLKELKKEKNKEKSEEFTVLATYIDKVAKIKALNKEIKTLNEKLDMQCRKRYDSLTEKEIKDLLINKKWYASLQDGIQNLYVSAANNLSKRIVELTERYECTLRELSQKEKALEDTVTEHLKEMGFKI